MHTKNKCKKCGKLNCIDNHYHNCSHKKEHCKEPEPCGCSHKHSFKCIIYQGDNLDNIKVYEPMDGEEVLAAINLAIKILQEQGPGQFEGLNVGDGSRVYKGYNGDQYEFRTLTSTDSIDVEEDQEEISFAVNEAWLQDQLDKIDLDQNNVVQVLEIPDDAPAKTPSEFFNQSEDPIVVDEITNLFITQLGATYVFKPGKGTYGQGYTQTTDNDFFLLFTLDYLTHVKNTEGPYGAELVLPSTISGQGGKIYPVRKLHSDNLEITQEDEIVRINVPEITGVKSYYVNPLYTGDLETGSMVNPYKTWAACKTAVIGTGTALDPENKNVRVVFQRDVVSNQNLAVNTVTYYFDSSKFTYTGSDNYVLDFQNGVNEIRSNIVTNPTNIPVPMYYITMRGTGNITRNNAGGILKVVGIFNADNEWRKDNIVQQVGAELNIEGDITISQPEPSSLAQYTPAYINGTSGPAYTNDAGREIYVTSTVVTNTPLLKLLDYDLPLKDIIVIRDRLTIETVNTVAIGIENSVLTQIGNSVLALRTNQNYIPYGNTVTNPDGTNKYTPNPQLNLIDSLNNASITSPISEEKIDISFWAVNNVGGINSYFGYKTTNSHADNRFNLRIGKIDINHIRSNHFLHIDIQDGEPPQVDASINYLRYVSNQPDSGMFMRLVGVPQIDPTKFTFRIKSGEIHSLYSDTMLHPTQQHQRLRLQDVYVNNTFVNTNMPTSPAGLPYGAMYRDSAGNVKIVI